MSLNPGVSELPALGLQGAKPHSQETAGDSLSSPLASSSPLPLAGCGREGRHQSCALGRGV